MIKSIINIAIAVTVWFTLVGLIETLVFKVAYPRTYVKTINMKTYDNLEIKHLLTVYNLYAEYPIFKYDKDFRPLVIEEDDKFLDSQEDKNSDLRTIGLTSSTPFSCKIIIRSGLDNMELSRVLLHEAGHCFHFDHNKLDNDLMSVKYSDYISDFNVIQWAGKIRDRIR